MLWAQVTIQGHTMVVTTLYRLEMVVAETYGEEKESILQTARLWQQNVSVIIGPVETCVYEVRCCSNIA